jgi:oligopeptide transport system permease protein
MTVLTPPPPDSPAPAPQTRDAQVSRGSSLWHDAWLRLRKNHLAVFGGLTLIVVTVACLLGPFFIKYGYQEQVLELGASPPFDQLVLVKEPPERERPPYTVSLKKLREFPGLTAEQDAQLQRGETVVIDDMAHQLTKEKHILGTDDSGRDLLVRILYGGRISLAVGLCATLVALTIGVVYGAVAGYLGGKLDAVMMRIVDIMYSLPFTIFVILLMVFFGRNIFLLFAAIGAVEWLTMARIVRGQVMAIKRMEYIEAARSLGFGTPRILFRHILPNILGPIIVYTTLTIPAVMLLEAFLSFLGLGVQPPMSSWGALIKDGSEKMEEFPWLLIYPGAIFSLTLLSLNFLGDGLRDALDVRSSKD